MIKETVDAVRLAEMEAGRVISTAEGDAEIKKNQVKLQAEQYRESTLQEAKEKADSDMSDIIKKCDTYSEQVGKRIETMISDLKTVASGKMEEAVDAVIDALV